MHHWMKVYETDFGLYPETRILGREPNFLYTKKPAILDIPNKRFKVILKLRGWTATFFQIQSITHQHYLNAMLILFQSFCCIIQQQIFGRIFYHLKLNAIQDVFETNVNETRPRWTNGIKTVTLFILLI